MLVIKFGGTSIASAQKIREAISYTKRNLNESPIIVVSAISNVTSVLSSIIKDISCKKCASEEAMDRFKGIHQSIIRDMDLNKDILDNLYEELETKLEEIRGTNNIMPNKDTDHILSMGEACSVKLISECFNANGVKSTPVRGQDSGIVTENNFGTASIIMPETLRNVKEIIGNIQKASIPVIAGFVGRTLDGQIIVTGMNSSDYTACVIAAAMECKEVRICTDVAGVMSADPTMVSNTKLISNLSFEEAIEISSLGARVLHPRSVRCCIDFGIKMKICNASEPNINGTDISMSNSKQEGFLAVGYKSNVVIVHICSSLMIDECGFVAEIFNVFDKYQISVDIISTSQSSVSITIDVKDSSNASLPNEALDELRQVGRVYVYTDRSVVGVVSSKMYLHKTQNIKQIFGILAMNDIDVEMLSQGESGVSLYGVIGRDRLHHAVRALHDAIVE